MPKHSHLTPSHTPTSNVRRLHALLTASIWQPASIGIALVAMIYFVDLRLPAGYAGAIAYVIPVLLGLWTSSRRYVVFIAAVATAASVVSRFWAPLPPGVAGLLVWLNRATAVSAIWITAAMVLHYKTIQAAADDERAKHRAILEMAVDGMITIDLFGRIELFNRAAERMFGWDATEVIGQNVKILMPSPYREKHDGYLNRHRERAERRVVGLDREVAGQRKDGSIFPLELSLAEVPLKGRRVFTAILRDTSERKEHERARNELVRSLGEKNAELEHFTYTVSHDLKSPLVTIKGFLGMLEDSARKGDLEQLRSDIARIGAAADRMRQLLDELLELSRIGRVVGASRDVSLDDLVGDVGESLGGPLSSRGVSLEVAPELPCVRGDPMRLRQVFQNLVENAVKFMGSQPTPRIEIGALENGAEVECWVRDNGIGIESGYEEKIFGLFEKLDRRTEGTGVGLALVRRIVEVHGGRISVQSDGAGCGTCFRFTLPAADTREPAAA